MPSKWYQVSGVGLATQKQGNATRAAEGRGSGKTAALPQARGSPSAGGEACGSGGGAERSGKVDRRWPAGPYTLDPESADWGWRAGRRRA